MRSPEASSPTLLSLLQTHPLEQRQTDRADRQNPSNGLASGSGNPQAGAGPGPALSACPGGTTVAWWPHHSSRQPLVRPAGQLTGSGGSHWAVSGLLPVCSHSVRLALPTIILPQCKKKHTLLCPDFARKGICPRGDQCQLLHRNQKRHGRRTAAPPTPGPSDGAPRSRASAGHVLR